MDIVPLCPQDTAYCHDAADLLAACFPCYATGAAAEIARCLQEERVALAAVEEGRVCAFAGAIPQYGHTGWELHPLAVRPDRQRQGIGAALLTALEQEVARRGAVTLYAGADDEDGRTSLYGVDLYDDLAGKVRDIRNLGEHPYTFYEKQGYRIVGVIPDANGWGKPDIWMAKRLTGDKPAAKGAAICTGY